MTLFCNGACSREVKTKGSRGMYRNDALDRLVGLWDGESFLEDFRCSVLGPSGIFPIHQPGEQHTDKTIKQHHIISRPMVALSR